jgi:archaellum component FlaF (FlaF/FlaG flagellin family)
MGYAVIMFVIILLMAVSIAMSANYGISKDSQKAPLLAENAYAEREGGKIQTGVTIVNTCLEGSSKYNGHSVGFIHTLNLTVRNIGSTVLNPYNSTIFYNLSYFPFIVDTGKVWTPLENSTLKINDIYIGSSDSNYPLRLMLATSYGITTISPTTPTNFSGRSDKGNTSYSFNWNSSTDDIGIAYYLLYSMEGKPEICPPSGIKSISPIEGNATSSSLGYSIACPDPPCPKTFFFITAVDTEGNMGVRSVTLICNPPTTGNLCTKEI